MLTAADTFAAGTVLWLRSGGDGTLTLNGTPVTTGARVLNGPGFLTGWGLEPLPLTASLAAGLDAWIWDLFSQSWQQRYSGALADTATSGLPTNVDVGRSIFARANTEVTLPGPDRTLTIRFYHQDHLCSSSVLTDAIGNLVEETANYAFGHARNKHQPRSLPEAYSFTQKERDAESDLQYFEMRFLMGRIARFSRVDPLAVLSDATTRDLPQRNNPYSYCANRPITFSDPNGCREAETQSAADSSAAPRSPSSTTGSQNLKSICDAAKTTKTIAGYTDDMAEAFLQGKLFGTPAKVSGWGCDVLHTYWKAGSSAAVIEVAAIAGGEGAKNIAKNACKQFVNPATACFAGARYGIPFGTRGVAAGCAIGVVAQVTTCYGVGKVAESVTKSVITTVGEGVRSALRSTPSVTVQFGGYGPGASPPPDGPSYPVEAIKQ